MSTDSEQKKALYVVGSSGMGIGQDEVERELERLGYSVTKIADTNATALDTRGKALAVISQTPGALDVSREFCEVSVPVVALGSAAFRGLTQSRGDDRRNNNSDQSQTTSVITLWRRFPERAPHRIPVQVEDANKVLLIGYESGAEMIWMNAPAKRVGLFSRDETPIPMTSEHWASLFEVAIKWAVGVEEVKKFEEVLREEWQEIHQRRQHYLDKRSDGKPDTGFDGKHAPRNLVGLALSGGGIRSATFSLGLLQGLHELNLLRIFDYLSTVSGGGYVGGWWSAWLARSKSSAPADEAAQAIERQNNQAGESAIDSAVEDSTQRALDRQSLCIFPPNETIEPQRAPQYIHPDLTQGDSSAQHEHSLVFEPRAKVAEGSRWAGYDPIHHLRLFANYLTPRRGVLSSDTWRAVAVVMRNLALTWLILLPVLFAVVYAGKLYLMLQPRAIDIFFPTINVPTCLYSIAPPIAALAGWIAAMSVFWLIFNKDKFSISDMILSFVCLVTLLALAICGLFLFNLWEVLSNKLAEWYQVIGVWGVGLIFLLGWALRPVPVSDVLEDKTQWKMEVRRNRIGRLQAQLMVVLVVTTVVLTFSVFGHMFVSYLFQSNIDSIFEWPRIGGWITILATLAGSIFTAYRATPSGGGDPRENVEPSLISRFVFAVTPPLVVMVLASVISWAGHEILSYIVNNHIRKYPNHLIWPLTVATFFGLILCAVLAVYEMKWRKEDRPSLLLLAFMCLVAVIFTLTIGASITVITTETNELPLFHFLFICLIVLGAILAFAKIVRIRRGAPASGRPNRFQPAEKVAKIRGRFSIIWAQVQRTAFWFLLLIFCVVVLYQYGSLAKSNIEKFKVEQLSQESPKMEPTGGGLTMEDQTPAMRYDSFRLGLSLWPLGVAALAGMLILFRLFVVEIKDKPRSVYGALSFELAVFRNWARDRRSGALWLLAAVCAVIPILVVSWVHVLASHHITRGDLTSVWSLLFLPLLIVVLCYGVMLFRSAVIEIQPGKDSRWLLVERWVSKVVWPKKRDRLLVLSIASICIALTAVAGFAMRTLIDLSKGINPVFASLHQLVGSPSMSLPLAEHEGVNMLAGQSGPPIMWLLPGWLIIILVVFAGFFVFRSAVVEMKVDSSDKRRLPEWRIWESRWVKNHQHGFLWAIALLCVLLAFVIGLMADAASDHFREYNPEIFTPITLVGVVPCLIFAIFEMKWGEGDNRRTIWLLCSAYLTTTILLFFNFIDISQENLMLGRTIVGLLTISLAWVIALGWMVDPNVVSMHRFYKERLVRAYLGASNEKRRQQRKEITDAVADDDVLLKDLKNCRRGAPYHLINTTLNLVAGRDLATAQRSAASFVLSQRACGSMRTGYRTTAEYMGGSLSLGTAVAASGAAVSPSMGSKKPTAALAMLMTLLNVRLGYWAPTPNKKAWAERQARLWPFYLLREFLSQTNDLATYCYLTDGGHFDNTGLYSLVERGCRFIVVADCGADPTPCFEDLGTSIRRCRIDFGTQIELDLEPLIRTKEKKATQNFVVGTITYSRGHAEKLGWEIKEEANGGNQLTGTIIVFKPAMMGNEPPDVRQYAIENSDFPQQTTANQWFDEAQFESYRQLGQFCAQNVLEGISKVKEVKNEVRLSLQNVEEIFAEIDKKFNPKKPAPAKPSQIMNADAGGASPLAFLL